MRDAPLTRRRFVRLTAGGAGALALGCRDAERYTEADAAQLADQRRRERERSGTGPYGPQVYRGYRGLAELPWFEVASDGRLRCVDPEVPHAIDVHAHLGIAVLFAPAPDLHARTPRVQHLLDCDREDPGCPLDLDVYINANFTPDDLSALRRGALGNVLWGSDAARTHTIPNLLAEMDDTRVGRSLVLPIAFGVPFRDDLAERWTNAVEKAGVGDRLIPGASVHPRDGDAVEKLRAQAARGARIVKLHPTMQRFYPDDPALDPIYQECQRLGLVVFFHGGRAGIEPEYTHPFALMRHYEGALKRFPEVDFVLGHAGARDLADALPLARRYPNAWLDLHGQGVTAIHEIVETVGGERLLFGSDWPFYHLAASLAKVLIVTEGQPELRSAILHRNAERLLGLAPRQA